MADNTSQIAGLFMTPEMYQQNQQAQREAQAIQMAQLSPFQQGVANTYMGVGNLVQNVGGALGGQDPQLKLQSLRTSILRGVNQADARSLAQAAQQLSEAGDIQGANALAQQSVGIQAKIDEKQAAREQAMALAREKMQSAEQLAADRNNILLAIAGMTKAASHANDDLKRQLLEQQIQDLKLKADEKQQLIQSQAQGRVAAFDSALDTLNVIATHPGKKDVVGALSGGVMSLIPGTNAAGFASQLETFKAQTFLPQVAALKGMGALSDAEGKKLTAAVGALDAKMKQSEFDKQVTKIKADLEAAKARVLQLSNPTTQAAQPALGTVSNPIVLK